MIIIIIIIIIIRVVVLLERLLELREGQPPAAGVHGGEEARGRLRVYVYSICI